MLMLMKKGLSLLNVNNTVLHLPLLLVPCQKGGQKGSKLPKCIIKEVNKGQKSYHRSRIGQNALTQVKKGQKSYQKGGLTKNGSKRRSKRVKDLRELLMLTENP